jgi:hypothetical protein
MTAFTGATRRWASRAVGTPKQLQFTGIFRVSNMAGNVQ